MLPLTFSANHNRIEHFLSTKNIVLLHVHDIVLHDIYTHTAEQSMLPFVNKIRGTYYLYPYEAVTYPKTNLDGITLCHEFSLASGHLSLELFTRDSQLLGL